MIRILMLSLFGIVAILFIISLIKLIATKGKINTEARKQKEKQRNDRIRDAIQKHRNARGSTTYHTTTSTLYPLNSNQRKLIKEWLGSSLFKEFDNQLNTIIDNNEYNESDKKLLSNLRVRYIEIQEFIKQSNDSEE